MGYKVFRNEANDFMAVITYHNFTMIELYYQLLADLKSGNEERALHIVYEIADTQYVKYAFKLLKRYAAREIGSSDPTAFMLVKSVSEAWEKDKKVKAHGGEADRHYLSLVVQYLARVKNDTSTKHLTRRVLDSRTEGVYFTIDESIKEKVKAYKLRELRQASEET